MATPVIPQEVFLLERYSSLEYFGQVRDQWEAMVEYVEQCLSAFVDQLPLDYRSRELPYQPDIVWGERVLPNFRATLQNLHVAYIKISHGDLSGLNAARGVNGGVRGQSDFWTGWMDEPQVASRCPGGSARYFDLLNASVPAASNIVATIDVQWEAGELSHDYFPDCRGLLDPPAVWPRYDFIPSVQVYSGEVVKRSGIYIPDAENSCAALLISDGECPLARALLRVENVVDDDGERRGTRNVTEERSARWTLVQRVPNEVIPFEKGLGPLSSVPSRVPAGKPCPVTGYWFTPAKPNSRRYIKQSEIFPEIEASSYGATFWQWSPDQSDPTL